MGEPQGLRQKITVSPSRPNLRCACYVATWNEVTHEVMQLWWRVRCTVPCLTWQTLWLSPRLSTRHELFKSNWSVKALHHVTGDMLCKNIEHTRDIRLHPRCKRAERAAAAIAQELSVKSGSGSLIFSGLCVDFVAEDRRPMQTCITPALLNETPLQPRRLCYVDAVLVSWRRCST